jgi:hypothetical protein
LPEIIWSLVTHRITATGTNDAGSAPRAAFDGQPAHAGCPGVTGPPVVVGTGLPLTAVGETAVGEDAGEPVAVWPCPDPPPGGGVLTVPHPAASMTRAASGTAASNAIRRPPRHRVPGVPGVNSLSSVLGVIM